MLINTKKSTKEKIILTAHELFYQRGIRATGVDLIIKCAEITKVTFYRNFPSKDDLISAYLNYRHDKWITWFKESIKIHRESHKDLQVLVPVLKSWFDSPEFRGCAFINLTVEYGEKDSKFQAICKKHKDEMKEIISNLLINDDHYQSKVNAIAISIDGAIVSSQIHGNSEHALIGLSYVLEKIQCKP